MKVDDFITALNLVCVENKKRTYQVEVGFKGNLNEIYRDIYPFFEDGMIVIKEVSNARET